MDEMTLFRLLFWGLVSISVLSIIYPWKIKTVFSQIFMHLPLSLFLIWPRYDSQFSPEDFIRVDVVLLYPLFFAVGVCYVLRWKQLLKLLRPNNDSS